MSSASSEAAWPLTMLLRELRLKVRRELTLELEKSGLWVGDNIYWESIRARRIHGEALAETLVAGLLGRDDFWWLDGSNVFGTKKKPFRVSLPGVLSFGFDLGLGMAGGAMSDEGARLCALFNLGITMFDAFCDVAPDGPRELSTVVHPAALAVLFHDSAAVDRLRGRAEAVKNFELRCVLKIVAGFFFEVQKLVGVAGDGAGLALQDVIQRAYRAQMVCSTWTEQSSRARLLEAISQKSTLPFHVMAQIAALGSELRPATGDLASSIGEIFGLLDDLIDLPNDLLHGQANSVVFEVQSDGCDEGPSASPQASALSLLTSESVSHGARRVSAAVRKVLDHQDPSSGLGLSILVYARSLVAPPAEESDRQAVGNIHS